MPKPRVWLKTFGCKVNTYDSGLIESDLKNQGLGQVDRATDADAVVLNSCAVTAEATKEVLRWARKLKREQPLRPVFVTGCSAQVDTEILSRAQVFDGIIGNSHKPQLGRLIKEQLEAAGIKEQLEAAAVKDQLEAAAQTTSLVFSEFTEASTARSAQSVSPRSGSTQVKSPASPVYRERIFKNQSLGAGGGVESRHTRHFLKIQDGCNSFCSFCVIPFARGTSRSISTQSLVQAINSFYAAGGREVVLTGVHIGDYKDPDTRAGLEYLVEEILLRTPMPRLRLSSLEPIEITPRLLELFRDERLCPHFHVSLQAAQTEVLKAMKRGYGSLQVEQALWSIADKVPAAFVGMDIIAGFPTETDAQFDEAIARLQSLPWTRLHVFPFSARPGVAANQYPGLRRELVMARAKRLRALSAERYTVARNAQVGLYKEVLVLNDGTGLTKDYYRVPVPQIRSGFEGQMQPLVRLQLTEPPLAFG